MNILIINAIIAIPLAIWLYRDSRARDFSWVLWTVTPLAIVLSGPVGVLSALIIIFVYFLVRPKGALIKCPKCGKKIHNILTLCPYCQRDTKKECLNCHEPVPWEATQCPFCKSKALTSGE
jgi:RNA polymerase subunit RPABC4/transcription elongation factor Spt4